jgi:hypothetical protein
MRLINELENVWKGAIVAKLKVLFHLLGETEENHEKVQP